MGPYESPLLANKPSPLFATYLEVVPGNLLGNM
jgi:hypothetical protein